MTTAKEDNATAKEGKSTVKKEKATGKEEKVTGQAMSFEQALLRLEAIVRNLESGSLSLDESLKYFQEGVQLSQVCHCKLEEAERKIDLLVTGNDGNITLRPAQFSEGGEV